MGEREEGGGEIGEVGGKKEEGREKKRNEKGRREVTNLMSLSTGKWQSEDKGQPISTYTLKY